MAPDKDIRHEIDTAYEASVHRWILEHGTWPEGGWQEGGQRAFRDDFTEAAWTSLSTLRPDVAARVEANGTERTEYLDQKVDPLGQIDNEEDQAYGHGV